MGYLVELAAGALILIYMAPMWEDVRRRLVWHAGVAVGLLAYIAITSGFELRHERLFFSALAGAWLFGVICHWVGLWARGKAMVIGRWRLPEIVGGVIVAIPLIVSVLGMLSTQAA